ncbi:hypothetical protein BDP55DRAFT_671394 [Colletotrichum godetiae]|uniref:Uncharacterized protein n=1 Tax=Colletotrichum godetiae TaxID=1209918 RepID=A0AAJ0AID2_9PEZI|nr:uncharacterized protein BDP55DRAFT_671394 [Colletotrichum godetiae]KAK1672917.1 hypothetical protein BDP55DRAFT_671394 [Colletotrichum godetiae]
MASHAFDLASPRRSSERWPLPADIHNGTAPRNDMSQAAGGWPVLAVLYSASNSEALRPSVTTITSFKENSLSNPSFFMPCNPNRTAPVSHRHSCPGLLLAWSGPSPQFPVFFSLGTVASFCAAIKCTARQGKAEAHARHGQGHLFIV